MSEENNDSGRGRMTGFNPAGIAIGMGAGVAIGTAIGHIGIGLIFGAMTGILFAIALGQQDQRKGRDG